MHRFIVGSGRCGSTLLSRMLACNPETLSVFEFLNGIDGARRFAPEPIPGAAYAELISAEQPFLTMVYQRGYEAPEVLYPFDAPEARFRRDQGLPWILVAMLPAMSERPHQLYDALIAFVRELPDQPASAHHRALFDWLAHESGRKVWVERSGASIDYLGQLHAAFPEARFLHIHRAGEEAALSMREHHAFRLAIMLAYQLSPDSGRNGEPLRAPLERETAGDRIAALLATRPPARHFGRWWTDQILRGFAAMPRVDAHQLHAIRFEDLLSEPEAVLAEVAAFLELPDPQGAWRAEGAALVRGAPALRAPALEPGEREALEEACRPGNLLLGRSGGAATSAPG